MKTIQRKFLSCMIVLLIMQSRLYSQYDYKLQTDGTVNAALIAGGKLYVGGSFTYVGLYYGNCVMTDNVNGTRDASWPVFNGQVYDIVPDGGGGWFVAGSFNGVNNVSRSRLVHIKPDNSIDMSWNPNVNNTVRSVFLSGTTLYIGGEFTGVGALARNRIAAIDVTTATATAWNPNANNTVHEVKVSGSTVYAGGDFTTIGGQSRTAIAALDVSTGNATAWNPAPTCLWGAPVVNAILVSGSTVYLGGSFNNISGQSRNCIAAYTIPAGTLTAWDPNATTANYHIYDMELSGTTLYIGGSFSTVSGAGREGIAALNTTVNTNNLIPAFTANVNSNAIVYDITLSGGLLYAAGNFTSVNGTTRNKVAVVNATTGAVTTWNPNAGNGWDASAIAVQANKIYFGGSFTSVNGQGRNNLAAYDMVSNSITAWNPNVNGNINTLLIKGTLLYAGGDFTKVGALTRNRVSAIDLTTGTATTWNPNANNSVRAFAVSSAGTTIYAAGSFTSIGGQTRNRLAELNTSGTGTATTWNPNANNVVRAIAVEPAGNILYAGGDFTTVGGQTRNRIAALNTAANTATGWNPNANNPVLTLAVTNAGVVYAGGNFTTLGGQTRNRIAAIDAGGTVTAWNPDVDNTVNAITIDGGIVYAVGSFNNVGGAQYWGVAALDITQNTNSALSWRPIRGLWNGLCIAMTGNVGYVGGSFTGSIRNGGFADANFYVSFLPTLGTPLPVQLFRFTAQQKEKDVLLQWTVSHDNSATQFEVERRSDKENFTQVGSSSIENVSAGSYNLYDRNVAPGNYQYRLKMLLPGNTVQYSPVKVIAIAANDNRLSPAVFINAGKLRVTVQQHDCTLQLFTAAGQLWFKRALQKGEQSIHLPANGTGRVYFYAIKQYETIISTGKLYIH